MSVFVSISRKAWRNFYCTWFGFVMVLGFVNATNVIMEQARNNSPVWWRAFVNEYTGVLALLILIPVIRRFDQYFTFQRNHWKFPLLAHFIFTFPFAIAHSLLFIIARKVIYPWFDANYEFGVVTYELLYEYRKITIGYVLVVLSLYALRHYVQLRYLLDLPEARGDSPSLTGKQYLRRMITTHQEREIIVETGKIYFLEAAGNYVVVHTGEGKYRLRSSLSNIEAHLDPSDFVRVHRSYIVNIAAIKEIQPWFRGDQRLILLDGKMVNLSRRYRDNFTKTATLLFPPA